MLICMDTFRQNYDMSYLWGFITCVLIWLRTSGYKCRILFTTLQMRSIWLYEGERSLLSSQQMWPYQGCCRFCYSSNSKCSKKVTSTCIWGNLSHLESSPLYSSIATRRISALPDHRQSPRKVDSSDSGGPGKFKRLIHPGLSLFLCSEFFIRFLQLSPCVRNHQVWLEYCVFQVGKWNERLPTSIPFTILSGDKGFCEVERQMEASERRTVCINPHHKTPDMVYMLLHSVADAWTNSQVWISFMNCPGVV